MSSMRNAVQRRNHRERAQPLDREGRLGLLEKPRDYRLRARDYKRKEEQLRSLREKAAGRNEDEFYFGMISRRGPAGAAAALLAADREGGDGGSRNDTRKSERRLFDGTVAGKREGSGPLSVDVVRLLKTQDLGYVRTTRNVAARQVERLREAVLLAEAGERARGEHVHDGDEEDEDEDQDFGGVLKRKTARTQPRKIVFFDCEDERDRAVAARKERGGNQGPPRQDGQDADGNKGGSGGGEKEAEDDSSEEADEQVEKKAQHLDRLRRKLHGARQRLQALAAAEAELEVEQAKMAKTATSGGFTKKGRRIKVRERKR